MGSLLSSPAFSRVCSTSQTSYFGGIEPRIFFACMVHEFNLVSQVWNYTAAKYPMNKGFQLSVNIFCCSTIALVCREGTNMGLFIPSVIRLTVGNSGIARVFFQLLLCKLEFICPSRDPQDFRRVSFYWVQFPEFRIDFDGTFSLPPSCVAADP